MFWLGLPHTSWPAEPSEEEQKSIEELFDVCETNVLTAWVLAEHEATRPLLRKLYEELLVNGGGVRIKNNFLPAAALATFTTLSFLLSNHSLNGKVKVELLVGFFEGKLLSIGDPEPAPEDDLFITDVVAAGESESVEKRLLDIATRLAGTHSDGVLPKPAIKIKFDHSDTERAREEMLRMLQDRSLYPRYSQSSLRGKSKPLAHAIALGQLLDLAFDEAPTVRVLRRYNVSRGQLADIFEELFKSGGNIWRDERYIAAAALVNPETLEYLIRCKALGSDARARQVVRFFQGFPITEPMLRTTSDETKKSGVGQTEDLVRVIKLFRSGKADEIVALLEGHIDVGSVETSDDLLYYLGMAYLILNRRSDAEKALLAAVESTQLMMHMAGRYKILRMGGMNQYSLARNLVGLGMARLTLADYEGALEVFHDANDEVRKLHLTLRVNHQIRTMLNQLIGQLFDGLGECTRAAKSL